MIRYIIRRLLQAIPTLFGVSVLSFMIISAVPGGPLEALTLEPNMTPRKIELKRAQLGLDDPWPVQYLRWLIGDDWRLFDTNGDGKLETTCTTNDKGVQTCAPDEYGTRKGILRGDWGYSYRSRRNVLSLIIERIPATLELSVVSLLIGIPIGVAIGILAAINRGGWFDSGTRIFAVVLNAVPTFFLALILLLLFGATLKILPMGGRCNPVALQCPPIWGRLEYLILPALILATGSIAGYSRFMRASMLDVINQDYVRTAKSKGLQNRSVYFIHAARNAMIPLATFLGPTIVGVVAGAFFTETIFSWPGLGRLGTEAVFSKDYPLLLAFLMIGAIETILGFLLSDILYAFIDPRIRLR
jgi:peptide/nickel transport system permease protein